jgi:hypothetical protein
MKTIDITLPRNISQYHIVAMVNRKLTTVLIDTGACMSHISADLAVNHERLTRPVIYKTFGETTIVNHYRSKVELILHKDLVIKMDLPIDSREHLRKEALLGMDFLKQFNFVLTEKNMVLYIENLVFEINRIDMHYKHIQKYL